MSLLRKFFTRVQEKGLIDSIRRTFDYLYFNTKIKFTKANLQIICMFRKTPIAVNHKKYKFNFNNDGDYEELLYHAHWQKYFTDEKSKIQKFVKDGDVVVDVGANIGLFSLILSNLVGRNGQVYSFEPISLLHKKLNNNVTLNGLNNIKTFETGLGDEESEIEIYLNPEQSGLSSVVSKPSNNSVAQKIKLTTLDKFSANLKQKVSFIKIDTEGYEPNVLRGASELIGRDRPIIYIELGGDHQLTSVESLKILKEFNYSCEAENIDLSKIYAGNNFIALPK